LGGTWLIGIQYCRYLTKGGVHDRGVAVVARHIRVAERFAENGIDVSVLPELSVALGDRSKIVRAIRELPATTEGRG
jgi:hypothetical protein